MSNKHPVWELVAYATTIVLAVWYEEYTRGNSGSFSRRVLWQSAQTCQAVARRFGHWGLRLETAYHTRSERSV